MNKLLILAAAAMGAALNPIHAVSAERSSSVPDRPKWCHFDPNLGWNFYCDPEEQPEPEQPQPTPAAAPIAPPDPRDEIKAIQEKLDRLKAEAVLRPTPENLKAYMAYQQEQIERASYFSDQWRRVLWEQPDLDYTLRRPVNTIGKRVWVDQRRAETARTLEQLNDRYGLFFFFSSSCLYCHQYSPILKAFADRYGIKVMAVSLDGGSLPEWPDAVLDRGQALRLGLADKPVPATILYDNELKKVAEVGFGLMSQQELEERIYVVTNLAVGEDY